MKPLALLPWVVALFLSSTLFAHTVALRLLLLALGVALAAAALATERGSLRALPPIWLPFALWAVWAVLSLTWSIEPQRSLVELKNEILYVGLAVWVCYLAAQAPGAERVIAPIFGTSAAAVCIVALHIFFADPEFYPLGLHGGAGNLSSALLTMMPCALLAAWYAGIRAQRKVQVVSCCLAGLVLLAAYSTLNRTVWLGLIFECVVIAALLAQKRSQRVGLRALVIGAATALAVISTGVAITIAIQAKREAAGPAALQADPRLALWPEVLERIGERPFTGYGFGRGVLRISLHKDLKVPELWHAHNLLLDVALQVGAPGVVLLVTLLASVFRTAWRLFRDSEPLATACGVAVVAITIGMLARNMTDMLWVRQNALLYWGVVGFLFGLGRSHVSRAG